MTTKEEPLLENWLKEYCKDKKNIEIVSEHLDQAFNYYGQAIHKCFNINIFFDEIVGQLCYINDSNDEFIAKFILPEYYDLFKKALDIFLKPFCFSIVFTIGDRIKHERIKRGWSLGQLAKKINKTRQYIFTIERKGAGDKILIQIANAFEMSLEELKEVKNNG